MKTAQDEKIENPSEEQSLLDLTVCLNKYLDFIFQCIRILD
jgi:hypothetical protein